MFPDETGSDSANYLSELLGWKSEKSLMRNSLLIDKTYRNGDTAMWSRLRQSIIGLQGKTNSS
jgi:hypothetical protein